MSSVDYNKPISHIITAIQYNSIDQSMRVEIKNDHDININNILNIEITEKQHRFDFGLKHVEVGQASDTVIEFVPFIWCPIQKRTLEESVSTVSTRRGKLQKKSIVC